MKKFFVIIVLLLLLGGSYLGWQKILKSSTVDSLVITMNTSATDLSPYSLNLNNLTRTRNVYEALVAFDRNLKIIPALASSWGSLDANTWEFKLRRGVSFQDGSIFTADSVVESFKTTKANGGSQVNAYTRTLKEVKKIDDYTLRITTLEPDPLLLSKLTRLFITKDGKIGTGPYTIISWNKGVSLKLKVYLNYWGKRPTYDQVEYKVTKNKSQRALDFETGLTDILAAVPPEQALDLPKSQLKTQYGLEVNFLMFNLQDPLLKERSNREAIRTIFDPKRIEAIGNNFVRQATQFVAPGVYGYNRNIKPFKFNEENRAKSIFGNRLKPITLDYLSTYQTLVEYISKQLREAGFAVKNNPLTPDELLSRIKNNSSQMFLVGWQADDGDAGAFLSTFIHSKGEFNGGRFSNKKMDSAIEAIEKEIDPQVRLGLIQDALLALDDELLGIPLFESSHLYAVQNNIKWKPRIDGLVLATEVR